MAAPVYLILSGVRRAVAARELGLTTIRAEITTGTGKGTVLDVPLTDLYSPKERVSRSAQGHRYEAIERVMADPAVRPTAARIEIVVLRAARVKFFTPLSDVMLEP